MASTGARAARAVVDSLDRSEDLDAHRASEILDTLLRSTDPLPRYERARLNDAEVLAWITADAAAHPGSANRSAG